MSNYGIMSSGAGPGGPVTTLSDSLGTKVSPDGTGNIGVPGLKSAFSKAGTNAIDFYGSSSYLVDAAGFANYTTIGAAITAAVAGGASATNKAFIAIKPGVYAENPSVPAGVFLVTWDAICAETNAFPQSAIRETGIQIQGTVTFTGDNAGVEGLGIYPSTGNHCIVCSTNALDFYIKDCKTFPINASSINVSGSNLNIFCDDCAFGVGTGSTTDTFYSGTGNGNLFLENCYVTNSNASTGCSFTHWFTNCIIQTNFNLLTSGFLISFFLQQTEIIVTTRSIDLITGPAAQALQVTAFNSTFSTNVLANAIITSNITSFLKLFACRVQGTLPLTLGTLQICGTTYNGGTNEQLLNISTFNACEMLNNALTTGDAIFTTNSAVGNSYSREIISTTATWARGWTSAGTYQENYTNSGSGTISSGSNVITFNPVNSIYKVAKAFDATAGLGWNYTNPGSFPYNVLVSDVWVSVDTSAAAHSVVLPATGFTGQVWYIKDRTGNAGAHNITITTANSSFIDGGANFVMNTNYQQNSFLWNGSTMEVF